jgi:site-specific DNA recombinase
MTLNLAFLAPEIVQAAVAGTLPHGAGLSRLGDLPMQWRAQLKHVTV